MPKGWLILLPGAVTSSGGPWVQCNTWSDDCNCTRLAEAAVSSVEGCAAEAGIWVRHNRRVVFHVGATCVIEDCPQRCEGLATVRTFVPKELCPDGLITIIPELGSLKAEDGVLPLHIAETEFLRIFGPQRLRGQVFHELRFECEANVHRAVAKVCMADACDEWSKYSLPRCHVSLGLPYDFGDSSFLYVPACERTGQFHCPPGLPLALQLTLKAGSRSAGVWAAMLEGLMPAVVSARRTLAAALSDSETSFKVGRYAQEWLEPEEIRLGCPSELAFFSVSRGLHMLNEGRIGLPMALCPTCCRTAAGRLRVVFLRDPLARLSSFFNGYWFPRKGHLLGRLSKPFETWVQLILDPNASTSPLFEASDLDHVRPALPDDLDQTQVIFCMEDVDKSLRRVEDALCRRYQHCTPLPKFPEVQKKPKKLPTLDYKVRRLMSDRFQFDYKALSSC